MGFEFCLKWVADFSSDCPILLVTINFRVARRHLRLFFEVFAQVFIHTLMTSFTVSFQNRQHEAVIGTQYHVKSYVQKEGVVLAQRKKIGTFFASNGWVSVSEVFEMCHVRRNNQKSLVIAKSSRL